MGTVQTLTTEGFTGQVLQAPGVHLVDFWATWCSSCQLMLQVVDSIATEAPEHVTVHTVNVDEHPEVARRYSVRALPTLIVFEAGEDRLRLTGPRAKLRLLAELAPYLSRP